MFKFLSITSLVIVSMWVAQSAYAGTLSCSITSAAACTGGTNTVVLRMSGTTETNAHAELASGSNYTNKVVCCSGVTGLGTSCSGTNATMLRLSGSTNAHSEQNSLSNPNYNANLACLSVPGGGTVSVGYVAGCSGYDTFIGSMSSATNAHIGTSTAYSTKICASATGGVVNKNATSTLVSSVFDTNASSTYNSIMWQGSLGSGNTGKVLFQFAASDCANGATNSPACNSGAWTYVGGPTCATTDWFDAVAPDTPIELKGASCQSTWKNKQYYRYKVKLCSNDCTSAGQYTPVISRIVVNWAP